MVRLALKNEIMDSFEKILAMTKEKDPSISLLSQEIDEFEKEVNRRKSSLTANWLATASQLISEARSFIKILENHEDMPNKIYLKAAIRYLVETDDVLSDFDSEEGLKDDAFLFFEIMHELNIKQLVNRYHKYNFKLSS